ncbi:hypothetical protein ONZ43_g4546 [Nemania bipapillata]|uniref:Uncharacterized protein n=1 Tax=Nemania bipapillata TaxID=110536 RepID=A0ACC2IL96_9PEZI|nr:hypothetical protein ONZ43_g4546 [Nemania bipapillata]
MSSHGDKALTSRLPSHRDTSPLKIHAPDWSKIDIVGQTILLAELTRLFGSFQNVCTALKLRSNEVGSFLKFHRRRKQASEQGSSTAEQWGRDLAVPADGEDIPQQRPVLICASSIEPACDFLRLMAYQNHVPAVQAWVGRTLVWPPDIDVAKTELDRVDIVFPEPRAQQRYSMYVSSLGTDTRAVVAVSGAWRPKADATPDARIAFVDLPDGAVAYGPGGVRSLIGSGRYYVCWPTGSLVDGTYNDFVLARNTIDSPHGDDAGPRGTDPPIQTISSLLCQMGEVGHEDSTAVPDLRMENTAQPAGMTVNPKLIFGMNVPDPHSIIRKGPFHPQDEPQGPVHKMPNLDLQRTWKDWPGQIFQFRLPHGYTVLGPLGNILTFDPTVHERYDDMGNAHGLGGTYCIVPFEKTSKVTFLKLDPLPDAVCLRMKVTQPLVFIRNGKVLPRFVEPGVHELSIRDGHLDLYGARGCYNIIEAEGRYNILPDAIKDLLAERLPQENEQRYESIYGSHAHNRHHGDHDGSGGDEKTATATKSAMEKALELLVPHPGWLDDRDAEQLRLNRQREKHMLLDTRNAVQKIWRERQEMEKQIARQQARMDVTARRDVATPRAAQKQGPFVNYTTDIESDFSDEDKASRKRRKRKRVDSDDDEYKPSNHRATRAKTAKYTPTPWASKKSQARLPSSAKRIITPRSAPAAKIPTTQQTEETEKSAPGSAPTPTPIGQPVTAPTWRRPVRTITLRVPARPVPDATGAGPDGAEGSDMTPQTPRASQASIRGKGTGAARSGRAAGSKKKDTLT